MELELFLEEEVPKEMVLRASDAYYAGDPQIPYLSNSFLSLATAKVSTSAHEAIGIDS